MQSPSSSLPLLPTGQEGKIPPSVPQGVHLCPVSRMNCCVPCVGLVLSLCIYGAIMSDTELRFLDGTWLTAWAVLGECQTLRLTGDGLSFGHGVL